jgi:hypothetical protein
MDTFIEGKLVKQKPAPAKEEKSGEAQFGAVGDEEVVKELKLRPYREFFRVGTGKDDVLNYLVNFFSKDAKEPELVIQKMKDAESKLTKDPFEGRLDRLYRYARLLNTIHNEMREL